uniref:Uncharacterized protein n=1 Tax=Heterorhabditis bacteriophora TaxID=37862 RepID=A0A1I7WPA1_HETBA
MSSSIINLSSNIFSNTCILHIFL